MNKKSEINIVLNESNHAKYFDFNKGNIIHQAEYTKTIELINAAIIKATDEPDKKYLHNTITILGTRGSGKTSFLLSIEKKYKEDKDVEALKIIDPTLIEEKGHVFLNVISAISDLVDKKLDKIECDPYKQGISRRKEWREKLINLAAGLPSIDGIGKNNTDGWQDPEYVMDNGLKAIASSRHLATNFNQFLEVSLGILDKKAFLLIFDDIDVDATKGWAVLETIRKYFTSTRLITLLSGDLNLYSTVIRQQKWKHFGKEILKYEGARKLSIFNEMVTELTAQYFLKIMQPQYRIHLSTLLEKKNVNKNFLVQVFKTNNQTENGEEINSFYKNIFSQFGIKNITQEEVYRTFMLNQPLRSQIHFLFVMNDENENANQISDIFLTELIEKNIDVNLASNASKYLNIIILKLLLKERKLKDLYQLQPTTTDASLNACLISLNLLLSKHIKAKNQFLAFDYFIRIGYLRNLSNFLPYSNNDEEQGIASINDLCEKAGVLNDGVLRDIMGHIECYVFGHLESTNTKKNITSSFIQLQGLNKTAKRKHKDRLDGVFSGDNVKKSVNILGFIPGFSGAYSYKNESRVAYSIYLLISAIGEILKIYDTVLIDKDTEEEKIKGIKDALTELSQLRTYPIPDFYRSTYDYSSSQEEDAELDDTEDETSKTKYHNNNNDTTDNDLATLIFQWITAINKPTTVATHLLGKISTRFFYAMGNIQEQISKREIMLGDLFHHKIIALLNSIIIEDVKENINDFSFLNINNTNFSNKIFIDNLKKLNQRNIEPKDLQLSKWLLACPLLVAYLKFDNDLLLKNNLNSYCNDLIASDLFNLSINKLLNTVSTKAESKNNKGGKNAKYPIIKGSPNLLNDPHKLHILLEKNKIPYEWFKKGDKSQNQRSNKEIKHYISSIFGTDDRISLRTAKIREEFAQNNIKW